MVWPSEIQGINCWLAYKCNAIPTVLWFHLLFTGSQRSILVEEEVITTDVMTSRNDASNIPADTVVKSSSPKSSKQPKLCNTHYGKKECNFKSHDSPKSEPKSYIHRAEGDAYDMLNLSAAFCSVVFLPTFFILLISIRHWSVARQHDN